MIGGASGEATVGASTDGLDDLVKNRGVSPVANSNDWVMPLNLNAGASNSQTVYVQLPASGASSIRLQLQTGAQPDWETRFEKALNLNVQ